MARPRIPARFTLMNRDYEVRHANADDFARWITDEESLHGLCDFANAEVVIFPHDNRQHLEHTYFHELAHALLVAIGQPELGENEAIVDALGGALHQYEKTLAGRLLLKPDG